MPMYILLLKYFTKETKCLVFATKVCPIVFKNAKIIDIEHVFAAIFEKGQMPIFKTHKIPAQAQLYYIHALCKLWGAQASSLQKKKPRLEFDGDGKQLQQCQSVV